MQGTDVKELCLRILKSDSEAKVIPLLREADLWEQDEAWRYYGDIESNYSTIGNQMAAPEAALVKKIVNSVDARLINACLQSGIDPEGPGAPQSLREAVARFFDDVSSGPSAGIMTEWPDVQRTQVAKGTTVAATGFKPSAGKPSIIVADIGEGQTPSSMHSTILSLLTRSNKLRIPFVQGRFNMGGTGALRFCGHSNLQLVISRRNPALLPANVEENETRWSFTIVRREDPRRGVRNSVYTYLAPVGALEAPRKGELLAFNSSTLPIFPEGNSAYERDAEWGTLLKLYEYALPNKSNIILMRGSLLRRLDILLPGVALPVRLHECRKYGGKKGSFATNLAGITVRLGDDKAEVLEPGFPDTFDMRVGGQPISGTIYAFKRDTAGQYVRNEGIIFVINGQTHGHLTREFFRRKAVGLTYLADSLLLEVDCSGFETRAREDLFMNSRDRLSDCELRHRLQASLTELLRSHSGLRALRERRRREELAEKLGDEKPLADALEGIIRNSPTLAELFLAGRRIASPFRTRNVGEQPDYTGKRFPTFFKFEGIEYGKELSRDCHINRRCRIIFETDAENEYLNRRVETGTFELKAVLESSDKETYGDYSLNLRDGRATLNLALPEDCHVGRMLRFEALLTDPSRIEPFINRFTLNIFSEAEVTRGSRQRKRPPSDREGNERESASQLSLPEVREVREQEYEKYKFNEFTALRIKNAGSDDDDDDNRTTYDFYVNMDNVYLKHELKVTRLEPEILQQQFKVGLVLLGLAMIHSSRRGKSNDLDETGDGQAVEEQVESFSRAIAPILLPLIHSVSAIDVEAS